MTYIWLITSLILFIALIIRDRQLVKLQAEALVRGIAKFNSKLDFEFIVSINKIDESIVSFKIGDTEYAKKQ